MRGLIVLFWYIVALFTFPSSKTKDIDQLESFESIVVSIHDKDPVVPFVWEFRDIILHTPREIASMDFIQFLFSKYLVDSTMGSFTISSFSE